LLELLIVLVLIGIMMVISVPTLRNTLLDDPLQVAGRKMIGYLTTVREKAMSEQRPYLLYVDLDENRLWQLPEDEAKQSDNEPEPPENGVLEMPTDVDIRDLWLKSSGTTSSGVVEVWVSREGYMDQMVIHLENADGEALSLRVFSFLPDIEVLDGYYETQ